MKLSSLAVAALALPIFAAAAHAGSENFVYYFQNGQRVVVTRQQAEAMTEPQIEAVCNDIEASLAAVKALDDKTNARGALIRGYVKDNYDEMTRTLGWADSVNEEVLPAIGSAPSLEAIAPKVMAVEQHNAIARKGQAAISKVKQDMRATSGIKDICSIEDCVDD